MQKDKLIYKLKRIYWEFIPEIKEWNQTFIFSIPGKIGVFIRKGYALKHFKSCGSNVGIAANIRIFNPQHLIVGNDVRIADFVQISAGGGIRFGNRVMIAPFVKIWSNKFQIVMINYSKLCASK